MKKFITYILFITTIFTSCDDYLSKYPHDAVPYDYVFKTQDDFEVALRGVYSGFKSSAYYGKLFVQYPDVMTDAVTAVMGFSNNLGILYRWNHTANEADIESMWAQMYFTIARANSILDNMEALPATEITDSVRLAEIKGEALAARALCHFDLARLFAKSYNMFTAGADAGIPYSTTFSIDNPKRETIETVYTNIITDLQTALPLLKAAEVNDYYLNKAAAEALLARVYLYMNDYNNAIEYAQRVLEYEAFKLVTQNEFRSMWVNDEGDEIIWRIGLTPNDAAGKTPGSNYYNDAQGAPNPDYIPTNNFLDKFSFDDIRTHDYFKTELTKDSISVTMVHKYPTNPNFASTSNANGANMPKVFRLAEQYLILAEAYAKNGNPSKAWGYIQTLRLHRINNYNPANDPEPSNIEEVVFEERMKELAFEGHLWFDYKRLNKGFTRQGKTDTGNNQYTNDTETFTIRPDHLKWLWPIPQGEINANDGISPDEQNPGY